MLDLAGETSQRVTKSDRHIGVKVVTKAAEAWVFLQEHEIVKLRSSMEHLRLNAILEISVLA